MCGVRDKGKKVPKAIAMCVHFLSKFRFVSCSAWTRIYYIRKEMFLVHLCDNILPNNPLLYKQFTMIFH